MHLDLDHLYSFLTHTLHLKYWKNAIFRGGRRIPFSCDGLTAVPDSAYALFTEKELEKIYNDRNEFYKKLMQMIDSY